MSDSDYSHHSSDSDSTEQSTSESEDDLPLQTLAARMKQPQKKTKPQTTAVTEKHTFRWKKKSAPVPADITWKGKLNDPPVDDCLPVDYFRQFFNADLFQYIMDQSNLYAVQSGSSFRTTDAVLQQGRGAFDSSVDANSGLAVVRWFDSGAMQLTSTHSATEPVATVQRWGKKSRSYISVTCPAIAGEYNQFMGGVDLFDMLMSLYRIDHRSKKWYRRIFYWSIHLGTVNGWLIYRRHL